MRVDELGLGEAACLPGVTREDQPDANGGFTVVEALAYLATGLPFSCFEQPCATAAELVAVQAQTRVPIIADESVARVEELDAVAGVAGVNLKIAKSGSLKLMVGGMVETRLGMTAAAHLAASLGGVDFADLDTAFLLTEERFEGGYQSDGPHLTLPEAPGLAIALR